MRIVTIDQHEIVTFGAMTRAGPVPTSGFHMTIEDYAEQFVVHRPAPGDDVHRSWVVSEVTTGHAGGDGDTPEAAVDALLSRIPPPEEFTSMIQQLLRDQQREAH